MPEFVDADCWKGTSSDSNDIKDVAINKLKICKKALLNRWQVATNKYIKSYPMYQMIEKKLISSGSSSFLSDEQNLKNVMDEAKVFKAKLTGITTGTLNILNTHDKKITNNIDTLGKTQKIYNGYKDK